MVQWCLFAHVNEPTIFPLSTAYIPATNYGVVDGLGNCLHLGFFIVSCLKNS